MSFVRHEVARVFEKVCGMSFLDKLERKAGWIAVPHLALYIICGQILGWLFITIQPGILETMVYWPVGVLNGEVWRLFSFIFLPPFIPQGGLDYLFICFFWYVLFLMSNTLEASWGSFRYTAYLILWLVFTWMGGLHSVADPQCGGGGRVGAFQAGRREEIGMHVQRHDSLDFLFIGFHWLSELSGRLGFGQTAT